MKKALSIILAAVMVLGVCLAAGCSRKPRRDTGNIDVDYGKLVEDGGTITNIKYEDDTPITFMYPNYFSRSSDEEDAFVAKGPDDHCVLMYTEGELTETRSYDMIAAYTDEEAKSWMNGIQLGLVTSQGVENIAVDDYKFIKMDDHLCLVYDVTVTYNTGLIQKNTLVNYMLPEGKIYTINAFAPISAVNKYGPLFSDVRYNGLALDEALPVDDGSVHYADFSNETISFKYNDVYSLSEQNGTALSMVPERFGMLGYQPGTLSSAHNYEELAQMPNGELLTYLASLTGITPDEAEYVDCTEEDGHLRLETRYSSDVNGTTVYVVVTQFVFEDGSTRTLFAYMDTPEPVKDIALIA